MKKNKEVISHPHIEFVTEMWEIERVLPYAKNAKIHTDAQVEKIAASIKEFQFRQPIVVDEAGVVLAGHGRRLAAIKLGMKKVPVNIVTSMSEKQKAAYRINDNKVVSTTYDFDLLGKEVVDILSVREGELEFVDMSTLGMEDSELSDIFEKFGEETMNLDMFAADDRVVEQVSLSEVKEPKEKPPVEYKPSYSIIVECTDEAHQKIIHDLLEENGHTCKVQTV